MKAAGSADLRDLAVRALGGPADGGGWGKLQELGRWGYCPVRGQGEFGLFSVCVANEGAAWEPKLLLVGPGGWRQRYPRWGVSRDVAWELDVGSAWLTFGYAEKMPVASVRDEMWKGPFRSMVTGLGLEVQGAPRVEEFYFAEDPVKGLHVVGTVTAGGRPHVFVLGSVGGAIWPTVWRLGVSISFGWRRYVGRAVLGVGLGRPGKRRR